MYIYDLFVYDANIHLCIWHVLSTLILSGAIANENIDVCLENTFEFFKLYNNNYRPIYHVESYLYKLMTITQSCSKLDGEKSYIPENMVVSHQSQIHN